MLVDLHKQIFTSNVGLDSMDALHLAYGFAMSVTGYVSFDEAWALAKIGTKDVLALSI